VAVVHVELDAVEHRPDHLVDGGVRRADPRSGQIRAGLIGLTVLVTPANLVLEAGDEMIGIGSGHISRAFVHRGVASSAQGGEFGFEFVVVEYAWIQHLSIVVPPECLRALFAVIAT
jgi:hypothetical protein